MGIKGKNDKMVVLACEDCKERNYTTTKNEFDIVIDTVAPDVESALAVNVVPVPAVNVTL